MHISSMIILFTLKRIQFSKNRFSAQTSRLRLIDSNNKSFGCRKIF